MNKEYFYHLNEEFKRINEHCDKCKGNFNDDCRDCKFLDLRETLREQIQKMKQSSEKDKVQNIIDEIAIKRYPVKIKTNKTGKGTYDKNLPRRNAFVEGYKQAIEDVNNP